jgi:hypothetical protein
MHALCRSILAATLLALAVLAVGGLPLGGSPVAGAPVVNAESPSPSAGTGGDTRSAGEGPGIVGAPILAVLAVLGLGLLTTIVTTGYVRISGGRRSSR